MNYKENLKLKILRPTIFCKENKFKKNLAGKLFYIF